MRNPDDEIAREDFGKRWPSHLYTCAVCLYDAWNLVPRPKFLAYHALVVVNLMGIAE